MYYIITTGLWTTPDYRLSRLEKIVALPELPWFGSLFYGSKAQEGGARRAMK